MLSSASPVKAISKDDFAKNVDASLPQGTTVDSFLVTEENINGDTATVKWTGTEKIPGQPDNPQSGTWTLNKENEEWKLRP